MNDMQMSVRSVECYLLVTAMSPELRRYIAISVASSVRGTSESGTVVAFSTFSDRALVQEMESLSGSAPEFVVRKRLGQKSMVAYSLDREVMTAINDYREAEQAAEAECALRLAKGHKPLKSLFLYDYIGSLDHENSAAQTCHNPSFRIVVSDLKSEQVTATITLTDPREAPASFALSQRTLLFLRKITRPQQSARSVTIEFSGNACKMQIGATPLAAVKTKRTAV
jgi:hypothetical protein